MMTDSYRDYYHVLEAIGNGIVNKDDLISMLDINQGYTDKHEYIDKAIITLLDCKSINCYADLKKVKWYCVTDKNLLANRNKKIKRIFSVEFDEGSMVFAEYIQRLIHEDGCVPEVIVKDITNEIERTV